MLNCSPVRGRIPALSLRSSRYAAYDREAMDLLMEFESLQAMHIAQRDQVRQQLGR